MRPLSPTPATRQESVITVALFAVLLVFSVWAVSVGWESLNLPGNEFRQAQTAISAYHIQQNHDFSLTYPLPVLGKPWSVPMEFPLYQWTVVVLSNTTGLELTKAGRLVSIVCFYLTLPFLYLLLGRLALSWSRRLVALGLVVGCPLYLLYSRSFLMETMALLFAVAFLWSYLNTIERQKAGWWLVASLAGILAGLVKVTTFLFLLMPAFGVTVVWLWRQRPGVAGGSWRKMAITAGWALGAVVLPCIATQWWTTWADTIKAQNPLADFLRADMLNSYLFGSGVRFSWMLWQHHFEILFREIAACWELAGAGVLALCFARRWWGWIGLLVGCFFAVQIIFPILYAWHEYYYVANAFTLMLAMGLALCGVLESRLPRTLAWVLVLAVFGGQFWRYATTHFPMQVGISQGGGALTRTLKAVTAPTDVLVIAGGDWSPITPYFSQRRALMIRGGKEEDRDYIEPALQQLKGERVGALVLHGKQSNNRWLIERLVKLFKLDARPVYTTEGATVYLHRKIRLAAIPLLQELKRDNTLELSPESVIDDHPLVAHDVELDSLADSYDWMFVDMSPIPWKFYSDMGIGRTPFEGREYFSAHPVTRLWFTVPAGRHQISVEIGIRPEAYDDSVPYGDRTDGVELSIAEESEDGKLRPFFSRLVNPRDKPDDRGIKRVECTVELAADTNIQIAVLTGPNGSFARDWAMLGRIEIK